MMCTQLFSGGQDIGGSTNRCRPPFHSLLSVIDLASILMEARMMGILGIHFMFKASYLSL